MCIMLGRTALHALNTCLPRWAPQETILNLEDIDHVENVANTTPTGPLDATRDADMSPPQPGSAQYEFNAKEIVKRTGTPWRTPVLHKNINDYLVKPLYIWDPEKQFDAPRGHCQKCLSPLIIWKFSPPRFMDTLQCETFMTYAIYKCSRRGCTFYTKSIDEDGPFEKFLHVSDIGIIMKKTVISREVLHTIMMLASDSPALAHKFIAHKRVNHWLNLAALWKIKTRAVHDPAAFPPFGRFGSTGPTRGQISKIFTECTAFKSDRMIGFLRSQTSPVLCADHTHNVIERAKVLDSAMNASHAVLNGLHVVAGSYGQVLRAIMTRSTSAAERKTQAHMLKERADRSGVPVRVLYQDMCCQDTWIKDAFDQSVQIGFDIHHIAQRYRDAAANVEPVIKKIAKVLTDINEKNWKNAWTKINDFTPPVLKSAHDRQRRHLESKSCMAPGHSQRVIMDRHHRPVLVRGTGKLESIFRQLRRHAPEKGSVELLHSTTLTCLAQHTLDRLLTFFDTWEFIPISIHDVDLYNLVFPDKGLPCNMHDDDISAVFGVSPDITLPSTGPDMSAAAVKGAGLLFESLVVSREIHGHVIDDIRNTLDHANESHASSEGGKGPTSTRVSTTSLRLRRRKFNDTSHSVSGRSHKRRKTKHEMRTGTFFGCPSMVIDSLLEVYSDQSPFFLPYESTFLSGLQTAMFGSESSSTSRKIQVQRISKLWNKVAHAVNLHYGKLVLRRKEDQDIALELGAIDAIRSANLGAKRPRHVEFLEQLGSIMEERHHSIQDPEFAHGSAEIGTGGSSNVVQHQQATESSWAASTSIPMDVDAIQQVMDQVTYGDVSGEHMPAAQSVGAVIDQVTNGHFMGEEMPAAHPVDPFATCDDCTGTSNGLADYARLIAVAKTCTGRKNINWNKAVFPKWRQMGIQEEKLLELKKQCQWRMYEESKVARQAQESSNNGNDDPIGASAESASAQDGNTSEDVNDCRETHVYCEDCQETWPTTTYLDKNMSVNQPVSYPKRGQAFGDKETQLFLHFTQCEGHRFRTNKGSGGISYTDIAKTWRKHAQYEFQKSVEDADDDEDYVPQIILRSADQLRQKKKDLRKSGV